MECCIHKLGFKLYASHKNFIGENSEEHYHTFSFVLYLTEDSGEDNVDPILCYADFEKKIDEILAQYNNKSLVDVFPFDSIGTSVENIGDVFFEIFEKTAEEFGLRLVCLEVQDNPTRNYLVSREPLDRQIAYRNSRIDQGQSVAAMKLFRVANERKRKADETIKQLVQSEIKTEFATSDVVAKSSDIGNDILPDASIESAEKDSFILKCFKLIIGIVFIAAVSVAVMCYLENTGLYPTGPDAMYHLYRADFLLDSFRDGTVYPLYDKYLYNGVQPMRYWPPVPVYILAGFSYLSGSTIGGYLLYTGSLIFIGGCGWLLFGWRYNSFALATALGCIWFFVPDNMRVYFGSGNLLRGMVAALLPWLVFMILSFLDSGKIRYGVFSCVTMTVMILSHLGESSIIMICLILFFAIYAVITRDIRRPVWILMGAAIAFLIAGLWFYPSVQGGLVSMGSGSAQVMESSFVSGWKTLNPLERMYDSLALYFGLSIFIICILGIISAGKRLRAEFIVALVIYFGTTVSLYPFISNLPMGHLLWMERFFSFAMVMVFAAICCWREIRKPIIFFMCLFLVLDCIPSLRLIYTPEELRQESPATALEKWAGNLELDRLKAVTFQRNALLDLSGFSATAPYYLASTEPKVANTFGAAWQSAATARNIVQLNTAASQGWYPYLFDRCLEMGNDTVQVVKAILKEGSADTENVIAAAEQSGYTPVFENSNTIIFSLGIKKNFGVVSDYDGITIGDSARDISFMYPFFKETADNNINSYTYEELKDYGYIYISGATYDSKSEAEQLLTRLADNGSKVYIDMNKPPTGADSKNISFLGVTPQTVSFTESFPTLSYKNANYTPYPFQNYIEENGEAWNTVYLTGLDTELGYSIFEGKKLDFFGTAKEKNIFFIGFNLPYHVLTSTDRGMAALMDDMLGIQHGKLPKRKTVPIDITYKSDRITVESRYNAVNTTMAYHDIFNSDQYILNDNNLLTVNAGTTEIKLQYPYFKEGAVMSISGILMLIIYVVIYRVLQAKRRRDEAYFETKK